MKTNRPVWLYWPNIIDYARIGLFCVFLATAMHHHRIAILSFMILAFADALDGYLARELKQESLLGTALDFTIDRVVTASLLLVLTMLMPNYWLWFTAFLVLDSGSHFMHLYATAMLGDQHHKSGHHLKNPLLNLYYSKRSVLFGLCFCHDGWLIALYWYHFSPHTWLLWSLAVLLPGFVLKTAIHGLQVYAAAHLLCKQPSAENLE